MNRSFKFSSNVESLEELEIVFSNGVNSNPITKDRVYYTIKKPSGFVVFASHIPLEEKQSNVKSFNMIDVWYAKDKVEAYLRYAEPALCKNLVVKQVGV